MAVDDGLRPIFRKFFPKPCHWQSIETGGTGLGVPDSNLCVPITSSVASLTPALARMREAKVEGIEMWIEYKATSGFTINLRPEQIGWHLTRTRHGGKTFVAVRRRCDEGRGRDPADELWLFKGFAAAELKAGGLRSLQPPYDVPALPQGAFLGAWQGGPSRWDWDAVRLAVLS